jgi:hypothetical protein
VDIRGQPSDVVAGQPILPPVTVAVVGADGNTVTDSSAPVTLSIAVGPAGAVLGGTTTVNAVNGVATFSDLTLNEPGTYTLTSTGGTLTPDTSNPFTVTPAAVTPPAVTPVDVTAAVTVRRGRPRRVGGGRMARYRQTLKITNVSGRVLAGPLTLWLSGLRRGVTVTNAGGASPGSTSLDLGSAPNGLAPGHAVTVTLNFVVRGHAGPRWDAFDYRLTAPEGT